MDGLTTVAALGSLIVIFGVYAAVKAVSPWGIDLRLSNEQFLAVSKRAADAMEKLSIGAFLYWFFQNQTTGLFVGIFMMAISFAITIRGATK